MNGNMCPAYSQEAAAAYKRREELNIIIYEMADHSAQFPTFLFWTCKI